MTAPDPQDERLDAEDADETQGDLAEVQRPMDDPQTRPALDPDVDPPEVT